MGPQDLCILAVVINIKSLIITLKSATLFILIFAKMQAISPDWFAAQQQTSTLKQQKGSHFYVKLSVKFNELSLFF